jgi:hypothetical protein
MNDSLLRRAHALTEAVNNAVEIAQKEQEIEYKKDAECQVMTTEAIRNHPPSDSDSTDNIQVKSGSKPRPFRLTNNDYKSTAINIVQDVMQSASLGDSLKNKNNQILQSDGNTVTDNQDEKVQSTNIDSSDNISSQQLQAIPLVTATNQMNEPPDCNEISSDTVIKSSTNVMDTTSGNKPLYTTVEQSNLTDEEEDHSTELKSSLTDINSISDTNPPTSDWINIGTKKQKPVHQQLTPNFDGGTTAQNEPKIDPNQIYANTFKDLREMSFANVHHNHSGKGSGKPRDRDRDRPQSSNSNAAMRNCNCPTSPLDRRSDLVDRKVGPRKTVLCYICCAEYQMHSLVIHQKTCLKKQ